MRQDDLPRVSLNTGVQIPDAVKRAIWAYFDANQDLVVLSLYHGFIRVKLGQLENLIVAIAGPRPTL